MNSRAKKINWLKGTLSAFFKSKKNQAIDKDKLISMFILEFNSTRQTALELLKTFEGAGMIEVRDSLIYEKA